MLSMADESMQRRRGCAGSGEGGEVVPGVAGFDEVEAVPLERLLDEQARAQLFIECTRGPIGGDDPRQQPRRAARLKRSGDGAEKPRADARALEIAGEIDRRELGVLAVLRRHEPVAAG